MRLIHRFRQDRRFTAQLLLLWLFLSGSLFCPAYAMVSPDIAVPVQEAQSVAPCHETAADQTQAAATCCESTSTLCCGDAALAVATVADLDFSQALAVYSPGPALDLWQTVTELPLWTEDICLRRSDPPTHLLNCTFLD